jgi:prepilin-type processing-associated H-X9-DG protein
MRQRKGLTLLEVVVAVGALMLLMAVIIPQLRIIKKRGSGVVCGTNLKGLGNAQVVYANDFDGQYACQGGGADHTWGDSTDDWMNHSENWNRPGNITVGASLYLLVRLADVSPKSFVCPQSDQMEFSGRNPNNLDIVDLWDFGQHEAGRRDPWRAEGPAQCVSYSYHQPYDPAAGATGKAGRYRADDQRSAAFAIMADRNPWYDPKLTETAFNGKNIMNCVSLIGAYWEPSYVPSVGSERQNIMIGNTQPHEREGQNVLYADGHTSFEKTSDVGVKNDNIYTRMDIESPDELKDESVDPIAWRRGRGCERPDRKGDDETPATVEDSFLVNDYVKSVR